jgi:hypothetical protein
MLAVNIRGFPEELYERAKIRAVKERSSLKGVMVKALAEYLDRQDRPQAGRRKKGGAEDGNRKVS